MPAMVEVKYADLVNTNYLCKRFGVSPFQVLEWRTQKGMPAVRITGVRRDTVRYRLADVEAWATRNGIR